MVCWEILWLSVFFGRIQPIANWWHCASAKVVGSIPRLMGLWCLLQEVRLVWNRIRHCLCGSHRPGFISTPVSSTTSLNFPSFAVFQKFQSSDFLSVIRGLRLSDVNLCLLWAKGVHLGVFGAELICSNLLSQENWMVRLFLQAAAFKYEWDPLNWWSCFCLRVVGNRNVWGRKLAEAHSICARENIDWIRKQLGEFLEDSGFCST